MSTFTINTGQDDLEEVCKETNIEERPGMKGFFKHLAKKRNDLEDNAKISTFGRSVGFTNGTLGALWLCSIPPHIVKLLVARHGWDYFNSTEFTFWLRKHPQFMMGRVESRM